MNLLWSVLKKKENSKPVSKAFYALVRGRVQGVGFRYSTVMEARQLHINGWVRNSRDGNVEVWAEGPDDKLALFLDWLYEGPSFSRVESIRKENVAPKGYQDFNVEH